MCVSICPTLYMRHLVVEDEIAAGEFPFRSNPAKRVVVVPRRRDGFAVLDHTDLDGATARRAISVEGDGVVVYAGERPQTLECLGVHSEELVASLHDGVARIHHAVVAKKLDDALDIAAAGLVAVAGGQFQDRGAIFDRLDPVFYFCHD